jgi:hypothetical protein
MGAAPLRSQLQRHPGLGRTLGLGRQAGRGRSRAGVVGLVSLAIVAACSGDSFEAVRPGDAGGVSGASGGGAGGASGGGAGGAGVAGAGGESTAGAAGAGTAGGASGANAGAGGALPAGASGAAGTSGNGSGNGGGGQAGEAGAGPGGGPNGEVAKHDEPCSSAGKVAPDGCGQSCQCVTDLSAPPEVKLKWACAPVRGGDCDGGVGVVCAYQADQVCTCNQKKKTECSPLAGPAQCDSPCTEAPGDHYICKTQDDANRACSCEKNGEKSVWSC